MFSKEKQFLIKTLFFSGKLALVGYFGKRRVVLYPYFKKSAIFLLTFAQDRINSFLVTKVTR
jgi:hypothetical protein